MRRTILVASVLTLTVVCLAGPAPRSPGPRGLQRDRAGVSVQGSWLPASEQPFLLVRDLATGAVIGGEPTPVQTSASGTVATYLAKSLKAWPPSSWPSACSCWWPAASPSGGPATARGTPGPDRTQPRW